MNMIIDPNIGQLSSSRKGIRALVKYEITNISSVQ